MAGYKPFRKERTGDRTLQRIQQNVDVATLATRTHAFGDSNIVPGVKLTAGKLTNVKHGLGRAYRGWVVVRVQLDSSNVNSVIATFTTNGSWLCPPGVTSIRLFGFGGGGGGGGGAGGGTNIQNTVAVGGSAGGGAVASHTIVNVNSGSSYLISIGSGGNGGNGGTTGLAGSNGSDGGQTTFGSLATFQGGQGGLGGSLGIASNTYAYTKGGSCVAGAPTIPAATVTTNDTFQMSFPPQFGGWSGYNGNNAQVPVPTAGSPSPQGYLGGSAGGNGSISAATWYGGRGGAGGGAGPKGAGLPGGSGGGGSSTGVAGSGNNPNGVATTAAVLGPGTSTGCGGGGGGAGGYGSAGGGNGGGGQGGDNGLLIISYDLGFVRGIYEGTLATGVSADKYCPLIAAQSGVYDIMFF